MQIGVFAFGRAGCKIAEKFRQFELRSKTRVAEFIYAFDTSSVQLDSLSRISEDSRMLYGTNEFEGTGTASLLTPAVTEAKNIRGEIRSSTEKVDTDKIDAFIVMGSLGGGTGGGGAPVCAQTLSDEYPGKPVYGVGILPAMNEASVYIMNAAQTIQSFSKYTDNLLLFDNEKNGVSMPKSNPDFSEDTDPDIVFEQVNQDIARSLHMIFSADEKTEHPHLKKSIIETNEIIETLGTGGLSTVSYASEKLPRAAQSGVIGAFFEVIEYFKLKYGEKKCEQIQYESKNNVEDQGNNESVFDMLFSNENNNENVEENTEDISLWDELFTSENTGKDTETKNDDSSIWSEFFSEEDNVSIGTGPNSDIETTNDANIETQSNTIHADDLPANDAQSKMNDSSTSITSEKENTPELSHNWPHPTKLIPFTLDPSSTMLDVDVSNSNHGLQLLAGPKRHLSKESAVITNNWVDEHTNHKYTITKNYPEEGKHVAVLKLASGIGIPKRIKELQEEAKKISARVAEQDNKNTSPKLTASKQYNVFENQTNIPESL